MKTLATCDNYANKTIQLQLPVVRSLYLYRLLFKSDLCDDSVLSYNSSVEDETYKEPYLVWGTTGH